MTPPIQSSAVRIFEPAPVTSSTTPAPYHEVPTQEPLREVPRETPCESLGEETATAETPSVWALEAFRAGDNTQVLALAEALPTAVRRIKPKYRRFEALINWPHLGGHLLGWKAESASELKQPWPDLVITAGRRNEAAARWIQEQSGGKTKIVHLGRPWGQLDATDLIVAPPQYRLPERDNVLEIEAPLHRVTAERLARESEVWKDKIAEHSRPFIAVLIGGDSGSYILDRSAGERLADELNSLAKAEDATLLITTSRRTRPDAIEGLRSRLQAPYVLYEWREDAAANPYFGFLGLADSIVVTGDSVSMITEACATGKPVYLFDVGTGENSMRRALKPFRKADKMTRNRSSISMRRLVGKAYRALLKYGPKRVTRDITLVHRRFLKSGAVAWLGEAKPEGRAPAADQMPRAVERVEALLAPATSRVVPFKPAHKTTVQAQAAE